MIVAGWLDVVQPVDDRRAGALEHTENGWLLRGFRAAPARALQPAAARRAARRRDPFRLALMSGDHVGLVALDHAR